MRALILCGLFIIYFFILAIISADLKIEKYSGIIEIRKNKEDWTLLTAENKNIDEQDIFFQTSEKSNLLITSDFFDFYTDGYTLFRILKQKKNEILIELYLGNIFLKGTIDKKKFIKVKVGENIILDFFEKFNVDIDFTIDKKLYLYQNQN